MKNPPEGWVSLDELTEWTEDFPEEEDNSLPRRKLTPAELAEAVRKAEAETGYKVKSREDMIPSLQELYDYGVFSFELTSIPAEDLPPQMRKLQLIQKNVKDKQRQRELTLQALKS